MNTKKKLKIHRDDTKKEEQKREEKRRDGHLFISLKVNLKAFQSIWLVFLYRTGRGERTSSMLLFVIIGSTRGRFSPRQSSAILLFGLSQSLRIDCFNFVWSSSQFSCWRSYESYVTSLKVGLVVGGSRWGSKGLACTV